MTHSGNFLLSSRWLLLVPAMADSTKPAPGAPQGLMVELLRWPEDTVIRQAMPRFTWIVNDARRGACQSVWRIVVERAGEPLPHWDSGKVLSDDSVNVACTGRPLEADAVYSWRVMTWDQHGRFGPWSEAQQFRTAGDLRARSAITYRN